MAIRRQPIAIAAAMLASAAGGWFIGAWPRYDYVPARWLMLDTVMRVDRRTGDSWLMTGRIDDLEWSPVADKRVVTSWMDEVYRSKEWARIRGDPGKRAVLEERLFDAYVQEDAERRRLVSGLDDAGRAELLDGFRSRVRSKYADAYGIGISLEDLEQ